MKPLVAISHVVQVTFATLAVVIGYLATQQELVNRLPYGITAGVLVAVATTIGLISKSIFPVVVTTTTTTTVPVAVVAPIAGGPPTPPSMMGAGAARNGDTMTTKTSTVSDRPPPRSDMRTWRLASAAILCVGALVACEELKKAATPGIDLGLCIVTRALRQESDAQIAIDCQTDIPAVLAALLSADKPASVSAEDWVAAHKTKAGVEARRSKAAAMSAPELP